MMVAGVGIFALYEVSTALSVREQRRLEAAGGGPVFKIAAKVCPRSCRVFSQTKLYVSST